MAVLWFGLERRRFKGPPIGKVLEERQTIIAAEEKAVGQTV
jgi:hypothetical protein